MKLGKDTIYNIAITVVLVLIGVVAIFKFIIPHDSRDSFKINGFNEIEVTDLSGNKLKLPQMIMDSKQETFVFIFELTDCQTCLFKGIEDMKRLKASGSQCVAIVSHDLVDEVRGWSVHQEFEPFLVVSKVDFYKHFQTAQTPLIAKIKEGEVLHYRYIIP